MVLGIGGCAVLWCILWRKEIALQVLRCWAGAGGVGQLGCKPNVLTQVNVCALCAAAHTAIAFALTRLRAAFGNYYW